MFIFTLIGRLLYGADYDKLSRQANKRSRGRRRR